MFVDFNSWPLNKSQDLQIIFIYAYSRNNGHLWNLLSGCVIQGMGSRYGEDYG